MDLKDAVTSLRGVGPKLAQDLNGAGIYTLGDLIDYWPRRYDDYSSVLPVSKIKPGLVNIKGRFSNLSQRRSKRGLHLTEGLFSDDSGGVKVVWFNQPYRISGLKKDEEYYLRGDFGLKAGSLNIVNPSIELVREVSDAAIIRPVYRETKNLKSNLLRKLLSQIEPVFDQITETLPDWLLEDNNLTARSKALHDLHLPDSQQAIIKARERLAFEEVLQMQLAGELIKRDLGEGQAPVIEFSQQLAQEFVAELPFKLTDDQRRSVWQIYQDMSDSSPMNRLVEGDVGSGKTVVACMAALMAIRAGYQVLFMAPTEILARQHAASLAKLLDHTPWASQIGLLIGALKPAQKRELHQRIKDGECKLVVGTSALIQDAVATDNVALVIIDEQHRFGVDQRSKLKTKAGLFPHVLCMTATPIPRTLALSLYGELSVTQLKSMPSGRQPIVTEIILPTAKASLYKLIDQKINEGRQAFIVCPVIEDNPDNSFVSAEKLYADLSKGFFKHRRLGLLHGGLKADEKDQVMQSFKKGDIELLVSTTVIEVGVDVPNASVMVVESAERFGLAQIHQLRGRVGRGEHQGFCYLVPSPDQPISKRLRVLSYISDGFRLSEIDLELRGPGAIYGVKQSGALDLRIASLDDQAQISRAKNAAVEFVDRGESLLKYPQLDQRVKHFRSVRNLN